MRESARERAQESARERAQESARERARESTRERARESTRERTRESAREREVDSKFRRTVQFAYVFDPNHDILTQTDAPGLLFLTPGAVSETMKTKFDAPFHIMVPFFEHTVAKNS